MIKKVVIDTNVIISALLFGGKPGELIPFWQNSRIEPIVSRDIVDEYIRVLAYPKFQLTEKEIQFLLYRQLLPYFEIVESLSRGNYHTQRPFRRQIYTMCFIWKCKSNRFRRYSSALTQDLSRYPTSLALHNFWK